MSAQSLPRPTSAESSRARTGGQPLRTLVCCFYEAYPPISGAAAVSFNIAKFLPGERLLIQLGAHPGISEVEDLRVLTVAKRSAGVIRKLALLPTRIWQMVNEARRFRPDLVVLEGASWVVYHWLLLRAIRKALPQVRVVYHAHNVEYVLRKERNGGAIAAITRWAEERLILDCDLATAVSEVDRALIRELYHADTALLPNGVDTFRFAAVGPDKLAKTRAKYGIGNFAIIFSGLHAYPPNRVAIDFLLCEVMPRLLVHLPDAQLIITGGELPCLQRWVIMPGLIPHEELPALIGACAVAAAPVFAGSGTRLKILEAMAANVPVVATSKAAEGLPLLDGQHLLIADDADTFAKSLRRTLTDSDLRGVLRSNAREVVAQHFDWRAIASRNPFSSVCGNVRENASDRSPRP